MVEFMVKCILKDHFEELCLHSGVSETAVEDLLIKCIQIANAASEQAKRDLEHKTVEIQRGRAMYSD